MRRSYLLTAVLALLALAGLAISGARRDLPWEEREVFAMDTLMRLKVQSDDPKVLDRMEEEIRRLEGLLSAHAPTSEVSILSSTGALKASPETEQVLQLSIQVAQGTHGAFDPTIGALSRLWGIGTEEARVPSREEILRALETVDYRTLRYLGDHRFSLSAGRLDLGGIAKGFAGDRLVELLASMGIRRAVMDLGGNVVVFGPPPKAVWRIGIQHPDRPRGEVLGVLELPERRAAVVTSGVYERYFERDGVRYHHILDPSTGEPARSGLMAVSVACSSSALADGLSTALFVAGPERGMEILSRHRCQAIFVTEDRRVLITPQLAPRFSLRDRSFRVEVLR
ncbi:FAD:protein FMN transferase [Thermanaerovibrio acidaminovorans]|uniref:FAD:protein FMN transferase n=1 Tax=Thermanaerovibrio acidaminovorans TaxID=81462 RepID=UPI002492AA28|nr:FAD:protein FMN transferase [Thermanaerovibrio acidaminovorans]